MKQKKYKILIFFCLFFVLCFFGDKVSASHAFEAFLTVNKTSLSVGEELTVNATVKVYRNLPWGLGGNVFSVPIGVSLNTFTCNHDDSAPQAYTKCQRTFTHTFQTPGRKEIVLYHGSGVGVLLSGRTVHVQKRPIIPTTTPESPMQATTTAEIIENIAEIITWVLSSLLLLLIVVGAFFIISSAGDPSRVSKGKQIIIYAIIGFIIIVLARGILEIIYRILAVDIP